MWELEDLKDQNTDQDKIDTQKTKIETFDNNPAQGLRMKDLEATIEDLEENDDLADSIEEAEQAIEEAKQEWELAKMEWESIGQKQLEHTAVKMVVNLMLMDLGFKSLSEKSGRGGAG